MIAANDVDLIIFDMDGTIVPSLEIIYRAIQKSFNALGWEFKYTADDINEFIGDPAIEIYRHITPREHSQRWEELQDITRKEYAKLFQESPATFPRVKETLDTLRNRGFRLALYSNASKNYFDTVLSSLKIREYLDYTECTQENNLTKPELVEKIREKLGCSTAAVVGDRENDIEAARETGSLSIGVLFGYGGKEPEQADFTISQFDELLDIFDRKLPAFDNILVEIQKRKEKNKPFVLGITGIDGAGKTSFAAALEKHLASLNYQVQTIHLDDFHNPRAIRYAGEDQAENYYKRSFNLGELITKVLKPLREKAEYSVTLSVLNPDTDKYDTEKEYTFNPDTIVIFEGVFLFREEFTQYIDYKVFLDIPFEESKRRAKVRDSQAAIEKYETKYLPAQRKYLSSFPPETYADMIIDNINWEYPSIIKIR
jgi:HAD superfamily hydrolase (TIGR01549 family)